MKLFALLAAVALPVVAVAATNAVSLSSTVATEKTVLTNGHPETVVSDAKHVVPGDRLILATNYRNVTTQPVVHFVVTNPVPNGVIFTGDSTPGAQVSVDGGRTFGALAALRIAVAGVAPRQAQATDVTHLRWTLPSIAPGASGSLKYRGIVR
ncbi:hypothetical protein [Sphingomonas sp. 10B4]|uniref:hypothetical protein n=1 Tax=Sphingomonas sp. 10B4 TaxID=3048575 RepID=UPI002AB34158|nr:hypothetical protein [Sphingomonas sp. 10B4]MDY7524744.1 hypothetical protein [Sphingomonas sp. 10B4]MEB0281269.1 hypothetical protein [Sphingomonas sp. 10B4]